MKKLLLIFSVTALLVSVGCKKKNTTPDNPDVNSRNIDSTVVTISGTSSDEAEIDVNQDGNSDFRIAAFEDGDFLSTKLLAGRSNTPVKFIVDDAEVGYSFGETSILDSSVGTPKPPRPHLQFGSEAILSQKTSISNLGYAGDGDIYIAFRINISGGTHYGWLKLNVSTDGKTLKLKSLGYNIKAEASLNAGEL